MPDKPVKESIEELLARLYALAHSVPEFPIDVLDLNQVTDEETMAMADADAFLERVTRRSKRYRFRGRLRATNSELRGPGDPPPMKWSAL